MQDDTNEYIVYSTFIKDSREAVVIKHRANSSWGVILKEEGRQDFIEYYPTHSEIWAENTAENFVEGIKQV
jgi:hypothetical protein